MIIAEIVYMYILVELKESVPCILTTDILFKQGNIFFGSLLLLLFPVYNLMVEIEIHIGTNAARTTKNTIKCIANYIAIFMKCFAIKTQQK